MKRLFTLMVALLCVGSAMAQLQPTWQLSAVPDTWETVEGPARHEMTARKVPGGWDIAGLNAVPDLLDFSAMGNEESTVATYVIKTDAANATDHSKNTRIPDNADDCSLKVRVFWDTDNLYVVALVTDDMVDMTNDKFEIGWATYGDYYSPAYDAGTAQTDPVEAAKYKKFSTGYFAVAGSYKTGNWTLNANDLIEDKAVAGDDYSANWDADNNVLVAGSVGWGTLVTDNFGTSAYSSVSGNDITYVAIIPFSTAMAGYTAAKGNVITLLVKYVDADTDKHNIEAQLGSDQNNAYCTVVYGTKVTLGGEISAATNVEQAQVSVYPNPASSFLKVKNADMVSSVSILNVVGQEVRNFNQVESELSIEGLQTGVYLVKMNTVDGVKTQKIMIQ